jgi:hypothetical protein
VTPEKFSADLDWNFKASIKCPARVLVYDWLKHGVPSIEALEEARKAEKC